MKTLIVSSVAVFAFSTASVHAAAITNIFDKDGGANSYAGGLNDGNWVSSFGALTPNSGSELFASGNGNQAFDFIDLGLQKELGGVIEDRVYDVSFYITKYGGLDGVEFSDFSTLFIGGSGGSIVWSSTPTPVVDTTWVQWTGTFTPSFADVGDPFRFSATFDLDARHSIGLDGLVVAQAATAAPEPATLALLALGLVAVGFSRRLQ